MSLEDNCWVAFREGNHKEAVYLLPLVKEPNKIKGRYIGWDNTSLLHLSSRNGWLDVTKDFITKYHCDPQERDSEGQNCLHWAAADNHVDVMRYLIDEYNCDPVDTSYRADTVLHRAAACKSLDAMKYLINHHHCDPIATNNEDKTVLHIAAIRNISPDVIKYLINECNCDPMAVDKEQWTPLHWAAYWGRSAVVECLLSTGKCDPLAKDNKGKTPLELAKDRQQRGGANTLPIFTKFGGIKSSHPIDSYVNVLLVGNPGAGKSTLSHVINDTACLSLLGSFRNAGGVVPCTGSLSLLGGRDIKEVIEIKPNVFNTDVTTIKLDIKDLVTIIEELTILNQLDCTKWIQFGLHLGLYDPRLKTIETDYKGKTVECFHECMSAWLRGEDKVREKGGPSWSSLATALDTIEEKSIATNIRDKYCKPKQLIA
uniref:Death domain-containing protein n=2 Tax=Amphimedon queenslandica TaxID=400682 RepID=A0A1X7UB74_AMPQE